MKTGSETVMVRQNSFSISTVCVLAIAISHDHLCVPRGGAWPTPPPGSSDVVRPRDQAVDVTVWYGVI